MKNYLIFAIALSLLSCKKDPVDPAHYGCVTGIAKGYEQRGRLQIGYWPERVYQCGNNQSCADRATSDLHIERIDVTILAGFSAVTFTEGKCQ